MRRQEWSGQNKHGFKIVIVARTELRAFPLERWGAKLLDEMTWLLPGHSGWLNVLLADVAHKAQVEKEEERFIKRVGGDQGGRLARVWFNEEDSDALIYWAFLHEFKHYHQRVDEPLHQVLVADREFLIATLKEAYGLSTEQVLGKCHDLLPEEIDANSYAAQRTQEFYKFHKTPPVEKKCESV